MPLPYKKHPPPHLSSLLSSFELCIQRVSYCSPCSICKTRANSSTHATICLCVTWESGSSDHISVAGFFHEKTWHPNPPAVRIPGHRGPARPEGSLRAPVLSQLTSPSASDASPLGPGPSSAAPRLCLAYACACRAHGFPCTEPEYAC